MQRNRSHHSHRAARNGFTLVELLVSVALVLTIMLLLAQVFDVAASTARKQRGTAENDQQARTFTILLKQDLNNRTMQRIIPYFPRGGGVLPDPNRLGYFYYSENDPGDQTDDVLAFTVSIRNVITGDDSGQQPYQGHATVLVDPNATADGIDDDLDGMQDEPNEGDPANYLRFHPNQPEGDDGIVDASGNPNTNASDINGQLNQIGMSRSAEVVYFLRGGNLYRRVMLIRDPYDETPADPFPNSIMQGDYPGTPVYAPVGNAPLGSGEFWRDFGYSAYHAYDPSVPPLQNGPRFNTINSLLNDSTVTSSVLNMYDVIDSLGAPHRRFGHNPFSLLGRPREFVSPPGGGAIEDTNRNGWLDPTDNDANGNGKLDDEFIGRFLAQETASQNFDYPGVATLANNVNPYVRADLQLDPVTRVVTQYGGEFFRRGEDLLMTNVIEFDVKLMDDGLPTPGFVDLGHSLREMDYNADINNDGDPNDPVGFYNILSNRSFVGGTGQTIRQAFAEGTDYTYDTASKRYTLDNITLNYGNRYDTWYSQTITDNPAIGANVHVVPPPYRPYSPGPDGAPGVAGVDDDNNMTTDDASELGFPGSDENPGPAALPVYKYPLRGIQVTVRYMDPSTDLIRQVTIIQSFVAKEDF